MELLPPEAAFNSPAPAVPTRPPQPLRAHPLAGLLFPTWAGKHMGEGGVHSKRAALFDRCLVGLDSG